MKKYDGYALITGGTSGIGLEFSRQLAAQGYNLVIVARDKKQLADTEKEIRDAYKVDVLTFSMDLSDLNTTDILFEELQKRKIHIGILVNNAGFGSLGYFHELPREKAAKMINLMCAGVTDLTYRFLPPMLEKGNGAIIITSSIGALVSSPLFAVYSSTKAYSLKFGVSLHAEYKGKGIDILSVCPGVVDTNFPMASDFSPAKTNKLEPKTVASESLKALGNKIVLTLPSDIGQKIGLFINNFSSNELHEKIIKKFYKRMWDVDL